MYNSNPQTNCYFDTAECNDDFGDNWECLTCHDWFCMYHWHTTSQGENVECASCEFCRERLLETEAGEGDPVAVAELARRKTLQGLS